MIPYLLAAIGGYLIGESQKKDSVEALQMARGGEISKEDIVILGVPRSKITEWDWKSILGMAKHIDRATFILKDEKGRDVVPQVEFEWYVKEMKEFKKAKSIIFPTKSEAIKRSGMLKTYYGNSARDFKVIKNGNGWAVSFEYVPNDVLGEMDGMMADGGMMAKGGRILVGRFDENQLRNGEDKKAIEKKMKETGLKYIDSRIIKKNGKPHIMEVYLYADGGMMAKGGFVVKAWQTKNDYENGNAQEVGKFQNIQDAHLLVDDYLSPNKFEWYAAEIYDANDGETLYHSEDDGYTEMADGGMMKKYDGQKGGYNWRYGRTAGTYNLFRGDKFYKQVGVDDFFSLGKKDSKIPNFKMADGGYMAKGGGYFEYIIWDEITDDPNDDNEGYIYGINFIDGDSGEALDSQWFKSEEERDEFINKNGLIEYDYDSEEYSKGGKIAEDSGLYLTKKGKKTSVSGQPNPYFFGEDNEFSKGGGRYGGWWKSSSNYSIKKFEELVKERIPTDDVKFDSESGMFYAEGSDARMRKFYRDLIDSATMNYPSEFPLKSDTEYFNWESKRFRKVKNDIKEGRDKEAIDGFYFQMFSNYGEKSIKNELKKLFKKIDSAEMGDSDSKYHISEEKAAQMVADVFKNVDKYNTEVHDTEPENNIIFFAQEKLKKRGYPRRYYVNLMDNVREYMYDEEGNYAKGGKVKSKKWIQEALTGDEGSLRRTAKRKGLLRGDENLSMTDLKKLQKMGGKTGKRAHLAETLRKFDDGGMIDKKIESLEIALNNPNLSPKTKRQIKMKLNEMKAFKEGRYSDVSKYGKFEDGGMMADDYAEGGVLAHGLREDDKIYVERGNLAGIKNHKTDEKFIVDISTGSREKLKD